MRFFFWAMALIASIDHFVNNGPYAGEAMVGFIILGVIFGIAKYLEGKYETIK